MTLLRNAYYTARIWLPIASKRLNARFTDLADQVSAGMGDWRTTLFAIACLILWIAIGPLFHWSDTWQLIANTPTTWAELFIGFLLAAAANRAERHSREQQDRIEQLECKLDEHMAENTALTREIHAMLKAQGKEE